LVYDIISLVLASLIQIGVAWKFYPPAFKELFFRRAVDVDMLVTLSTTAAYIFSVVSFTLSAIGKPLGSGQFFETSTLLATIVLLSRLISDFARHRAMESVSIRSLQDTKALLINKDGITMELDSRLLQYNDVFRVPSHSKVVTDGIVIHGASEIDESMMTGESKSVPKVVGSGVTAGSINGSASLDVVVTNLPAENTISVIAKLVDEAALSKAPVQEIADKVAGYFVPAMIALTVIVFVIQVLIGVLHVRPRKSPVVDALKYAIATLVVSCPCAIALAVPMVVVIAGGVAAAHGVVLKEPRVLESASNSTHVIFDKTGTLTHGEMSVMVAEYLGRYVHSQPRVWNQSVT
jgi:Cu2+-exporting ATPase